LQIGSITLLKFAVRKTLFLGAPTSGFNKVAGKIYAEYVRSEFRFG
jgi:hypothetical protein